MTRHPTQGECLKPTLERRHALQAARRLRARDTPLTEYRCDLCGGWHVGTTNGMHKQRRIPTLHTNHTPHLELA